MQHAGRKGEVVAAAMIAATAVHSFVQKRRAAEADRKLIRLRFEPGTEEHYWLKLWVASQHASPKSTNRMFQVSLNNQYHNAIEPVGRNDQATPPSWILSPQSVAGLTFEGDPVSIDQEETSSENRGRSKSVLVAIQTNDVEKVRRFLDTIAAVGMTSLKQQRIPAVYAADTWGGWMEIRKVPEGRHPVLPIGVLEGLSEDLRWFRENEAWYSRVGVPYRRGYLFHGIPGSGKTTSAVALAAQAGMDIHILPLDGVSDERMLSLVRSASRDSIILFEDIDCISATQDRQAAGGVTKPEAVMKDAPTLQGLLNCIDGVASPEGRIIIATTNYLHRIDKALTRPGRFDVKREFGPADQHQAAELARRFGLGPSAEEFGAANAGQSMAAIQAKLIEICGLGGVPG